MSSIFPSFVAKEDIINQWCIGCNAKAMKCVFVKRNDTKDREKALNLIIERQKEIHEERNNNHSPFVIFPEGTTSNGIGLIEFKRGAFCSCLPLQPVVLIYSSNYFIPSFEILPIHIFFPLLLSNMSIIRLDAYFLPVIFPPEISDGKSSLTITNDEAKCNLYAQQARVKMLETLHKFHPITSKLDLKKLLLEFRGSYQLKVEAYDELKKLAEKKKNN